MSTGCRCGDALESEDRTKLRTLAILNASSGSADIDRVERLRERLHSRGAEWQIRLAQDGAELAALAQAARESDSDIIVAGGGDGTISTVAAHIADSGKVFAVLPFGTLNHFAKDLGIPLEIDEALENIFNGHTAMIDVGEVNGRTFLNNSSLGLYPKIVRRRDAQRKFGRPKWLAMIAALFRTVRQYSVFHVRVAADGKRLHRRTPILFVGNNEYQIEGRDLGGRRCLDRGVLCLYMLHNTGPWGLFKFTLRALLRRAWRIKDFDALLAQEIEVRMRRKRVRVALDGELAEFRTPLQYRIRKGALRVIVPETTKE